MHKKTKRDKNPYYDILYDLLIHNWINKNKKKVTQLLKPWCGAKKKQKNKRKPQNHESLIHYVIELELWQFQPYAKHSANTVLIETGIL